MRFFAGFLTGLLFRPILRFAGFLVVLVGLGAIASNAIQNTTAARAAGRATIVRAVDGDTVIARIDGRQERVRVLGIDTPETVKPNTPVQPCGLEASTRAKTWVHQHPTVKLVADPAAPNHDRYSRLLRYVEPTDGGRDLSTVQVTAGLARVKAYGEDLDKLPALQASQRRAKAAHRGLWGGTCSR